jgi:hypothetical protein
MGTQRVGFEVALILYEGSSETRHMYHIPESRDLTEHVPRHVTHTQNILWHFTYLSRTINYKKQDFLQIFKYILYNYFSRL